MDTRAPEVWAEPIRAPHADRGVGMTVLYCVFTERLIDTQLAEP